MSGEYNWCHGPKCHEHKTVDRIRGTKGNKVLRTRKIAINKWNENSVWSHFCSQGCYTDFMHKFLEEQIALHPVPNALETKISDPVKTKHTTSYGHVWTTTDFVTVDT